MQTPERAGWYDDPDDAEQLRYFDGIVWSERRVPKKAPVREPAPEPPTDPQATRDAWVRHTPSPHPTQHQTQGGWQQPGWQQPASPSAAGAPVSADGRPYAGFGLRLASWLIDLMVIWAVGGLLSIWAWWLWMSDYVAFAMDNLGDPQAVQDLEPEVLVGMFEWTWFAVAIAIMAFVAWLYTVLMLTRRGATLGKIATGSFVRVAGGRDVGPLPMPVAARRTSVVVMLWVLTTVPVISWFALPVLVLAHLWVLRDPRRQAAHDKAAGTEVVRR